LKIDWHDANFVNDENKVKKMENFFVSICELFSTSFFAFYDTKKFNFVDNQELICSKKDSKHKNNSNKLSKQTNFRKQSLIETKLKDNNVVNFKNINLIENNIKNEKEKNNQKSNLKSFLNEKIINSKEQIFFKIFVHFVSFFLLSVVNTENFERKTFYCNALKNIYFGSLEIENIILCMVEWTFDNEHKNLIKKNVDFKAKLKLIRMLKKFAIFMKSKK
jgi:hypothetical protein